LFKYADKEQAIKTDTRSVKAKVKLGFKKSWINSDAPTKIETIINTTA
jgi:hypothetical protein